MDNVARILSPGSASWVMWVLLGLLVLALCVGLFGSDIAALVRSLFSKSDRMYIERNTQGILYTVIVLSFRIGIIALVGYLWIYDVDNFAIVNYLLVVGVATSLLIIQWLLLKGVGNIFLPQKQLAIAMEQRSMVCNAMAMMLWPIALVMLYTEKVTSTILCSIAGGLFVILMCVKYVQLFYQNMLSVGYMLLYVISLEVLPMLAALLWAQKLIQ
jgi:TM2 domain-containing membrane protein YozV